MRVGRPFGTVFADLRVGGGQLSLELLVLVL